MLGKYSSTDQRVAEQHIAWASAHGIDFFALDWWPSRRNSDDVIDRGYLSARNRGDVGFCIFYEAWALNFVDESGVTVMDEEANRTLANDLVHLARKYFNKPGYLKLGGRPVVVLYLTRTMVGDVGLAIRSARERLKAEGHDVFLVADEIHWKVVPENAPIVGTFEKTEQPQPHRAALFDAITPYTVYDPANTHHAGYANATTLVRDVNDLYERYRKATSGRVPVIPSVVPGYNDRGTRLGEDHFVLPRRWQSEATSSSLLGELLDRIGYPNVDNRAPLLFVTSWNEWNEDTAVEPLVPAPATSQDAQLPAGDHTMGYQYDGDGFAALEAIRDRVAVVTGRVTDESGRPMRDVRVFGRQDGRVVVTDRTDSDGKYLLVRSSVHAGSALSVATRTDEPTREVVVQPRRTVGGVDFVQQAGS